MVRMTLSATTPPRHRLKISTRTRRTAGHLSLVAKVGATRPAQLARRVTVARKLLQAPLLQVPLALKEADRAAAKVVELPLRPPPLFSHSPALPVQKTDPNKMTATNDFRQSPIREYSNDLGKGI